MRKTYALKLSVAINKLEEDTRKWKKDSMLMYQKNQNIKNNHPT